jgi:hypothetical protein
VSGDPSGASSQYFTDFAISVIRSDPGSEISHESALTHFCRTTSAPIMLLPKLEGTFSPICTPAIFESGF